MATISLARPDPTLALPPVVCLKTLRPEFQSLHEFRLMLVDEAEIASKLNHPNCIKTFQSGANDGASFLSMEYVVGETLDLLLRYAIKLTNPLMPHAVVAILASVCDALEHAHGMGIIHRDVSPENIIISDRGVAKLLDFGVAKARDRHQITATGVFKGKFSYMAPEQLGNEPVDARCDVYMVGVTLYSCLANRRPFEGLDLEDLFVAKMYKRLPAPTEFVKDLDPRLSLIAQKALSRSPDDRFQSAAEMAAAMRECVPAEASEHLAAMMLHERLTEPVREKRQAFEHLLAGDTSDEVLRSLRVKPIEEHELPFATDPAKPRRWSSLTEISPQSSAEMDAFSLEHTDQTDPERTEPPTMISSRHLIPIDMADHTPPAPSQAHLIEDLAVPETGDLEETESNVESSAWDDTTRQLVDAEKPKPASPSRAVIERVSLSPPVEPVPAPRRSSFGWALLFGLFLGFAAGLYAQKLYTLIP